MEDKKLYAKKIISEGKTVFHLDYFLLESSVEQGMVYGAAIQKMDSDGNMETDYAKGLFEDLAEAEGFLARLAEGLAFPVELAALCDDHISGQEFQKKRGQVQAAS